MFGMGFAEIIIIAVIAIIFLGPDKLPETMINIAKFFRSVKSTIANAKDSLDQELNISELKKEALGYKSDLMAASNELDRVTNMANLDDDFDFIHDSDTKTTTKNDSSHAADKKSSSTKTKTVTFEKKNKSAEENA